jgi:conjugative transfer pilus assembly protein TraH
MKLNLLTGSLFMVSLLNTPLATASLDDQMRDTFNMLTNTTDPNAYNTARRGVISGGSLFMKAPIKRSNLVSATAPSVSAGCGGINLYGGSFSFINKDEFIQTFQAIGANALGYGVKLALQSACPTCEQIMTSLEKTAQFVNDMNIDSCQAAQGIVNAGIDFATTAKADTSSKTLGVNSGQWEDLNEAWGWANEAGRSPSKVLATADPTTTKEKITINATWKAMKESEVHSLYGGDDEFLELLMTMIGTVVIKNGSSDPESDPKPTVYQGRTIRLIDLIDGGTFKIYDCDTSDKNGCLNAPLAPSKSVTIKGLRERVYDALLGSDGVIVAYQNDTEWSTNAKQTLKFPTMIGQLCNQKIYQAAVNGTVATVGTYIANTCAERLALDLAYMQVTSYIQVTQAALKNLFTTDSQESAKTQAEKVLLDSSKYYLEEYNLLSKDSDFQDIKAKLDSVNFGEGETNTLTGK